MSQQDAFALRSRLAKITRFSGGRKAKLLINGYTLVVELALTPKEQWLGLSGRTMIGKNEGMAFVYPRPDKLPFWMQGTALPLSVIFVRDDGTVVGMHDLVPFSEDTIKSPEPVRIAVEAPRGWFASADLRVGDKIALNLG